MSYFLTIVDENTGAHQNNKLTNIMGFCDWPKSLSNIAAFGMMTLPYCLSIFTKFSWEMVVILM